QVDKDQNGVLSPNECLSLLREHASLQRNNMLDAMRIVRHVLVQFQSPYVSTEACRLACLSLAAFDEQMDLFEKESEVWRCVVLCVIFVCFKVCDFLFFGLF